MTILFFIISDHPELISQQFQLFFAFLRGYKLLTFSEIQTLQKQVGYLKLSDEVILSKLLNLPEHNSKLKTAKKIATDYQNRNLFKPVFELTLTGTTITKKRMRDIREELSKSSKVDINEIFVDSSNTSSIPLSPSKKESKSIILLEVDNNKTKAKEIQISNIQLVSVMSGFMKILRVYTPAKNRKKVEIAAKSILGDQK